MQIAGPNARAQGGLTHRRDPGVRAAEDDVAEITRPVRELYDFAHVTLAPGESRTVSFILEAGRLGYYGRDNTYRTDPGTFTVWIAPNAAAGTPVTVLVAD